MDEKDKQELFELQRMVDSEGWRIFVRNTEAQLDLLRQQGWSSIKSMEQLWYAKGCMDTMTTVANFDKTLATSAQEDLDLA